MTPEEELLEIKQKYDLLKEKKARLEGQLQEVMSRLKEKGFNSIEEAEQYREKTQKEIEEKRAQFEEGVKKLKESYEW